MISDPWLDGFAFDQGWSLLTGTKFPYESFRDITHIWISHEHPDHFAPQCLAKIPREYARNIVFLFQDTADKRVINYCKNKCSFKEYIELKKEQWFSLSRECLQTPRNMKSSDLS